MTTFAPSTLPRRPVPTTAGDVHAVFGQVMGLVACTLGFTALGAWAGRDLGGGAGLVAFVAALACLLALNRAVARSEPLAVALLLTLGLLLGLVLGPGLAAYSAADPAAVWQAAGATALFVASLGSYGWATRRDLSVHARALTWALVALLVAGLVLLFVTLPGATVVWALVGLVVFGGFTAIDFQRLRSAGATSAVPIAAGIFLDVLNVFQLFLLLLGGRGGRG